MCVGEFEGLLQQQDILGGNKWLRQLDTKNSVGFKLKKKLLLLLLFFFLEKNEYSLLLLFGFDSAAPASFFLSFSVKTGAMNVLPGAETIWASKHSVLPTRSWKEQISMLANLYFNRAKKIHRFTFQVRIKTIESSRNFWFHAEQKIEVFYLLLENPFSKFLSFMFEVFKTS